MLLVWLAFFVPPASAAPSASEIALARDWYAQGRALQADGRWALASAKYRQALTIKDTPGLRYLLGYCEEQLERLVEARLEYDRAAELIALGAQAADVAALLPHALARLKRTTPTLSIRVATTGAHARLRIDERWYAREPFGTSIPMNPGSYRLRISAPGYQDYSVVVTLGERARVTLDVRLVPKRAPTARLRLAACPRAGLLQAPTMPSAASSRFVRLGCASVPDG